jgi:hypothetical protein
MPRAVFQIEEDNENLTEEEKDAFSYILAVRAQKQNILVARKGHNNLRIEEEQKNENGLVENETELREA